MRKMIPILVVIILVLSGLGIVAVPNEEQIENKPLIKQDWLLEIEFKGGFYKPGFGYIVTIENIGNESVTGDISIYITTDAWIMLWGSDHFGFHINQVEYKPEDPQVYPFQPVRGFGPAIINLSGVFTTEIGGEYPFEAEVKGFVFLFCVLCGKTILNIP
jgi:hypothetical protein